MVCKNKWLGYVEQLGTLTNLPAGSTDAALRCVKPECRRPLRKDGTCVLGHAQDATLASDPVELEALRCVLAEVIDQGRQILPDRKRPNLGRANPVLQEVARLLVALDQNAPDTDRQAVFLRLAELLEPLTSVALAHSYQAREDIFQDPRARLTRAAAARLLSARAAQQLAATPPATGALATAWHDAALAHKWSADAETTAQAWAVLQNIVPVLRHAAPAAGWRDAVVDGTGKALARKTGGLTFGIDRNGVERELAANGGIWLTPHWIESSWSDSAQPSWLATDRATFSPAALTALTALGLQPETTRCFLSLPDMQRLHEDVLATAQTALVALRPQREQLQAATAEGGIPTAIALWQEAIRWQQEYAGPVGSLGAVGHELLAECAQMRAEVAAMLHGLKPAVVAKALGKLGYEARVIELLKYRAVREVVFDPHSETDALTDLPTLAPHIITGLKFCEDIEALRDLRILGPRRPAQVQQLLRLRALLESIPLTAPAPGQEKKRNGMVGRLVDAVSAHAAPGRAPFYAEPSGYYSGLITAFGKNTRLSQAVNLFVTACDTAETRAAQYSLTEVRGWAEAAALPRARYAARSHIASWLGAYTPERRANVLHQMRHDLQGQYSRALRAPDRTGADRTYKVGERIRADVGGMALDGTVTNCVLAGVNVDAAGYCDDLAPSVEVALADGSSRVLPIAQVEFVPRNKR